MIQINTAQLAKSLRNLEKIRKKVSDTADGRFRQKLYYFMEVAAKVSPQFSGDFASNWNFSVNGKVPAYKQWSEKGLQQSFRERKRIGKFDGVQMAPHIAGDPEAVAASLARGRGQLTRVTRKDKISLVNATSLYTDGTHMIGPDGTVALRPQNLIPGNVRIESYVRAQIAATKDL